MVQVQVMQVQVPAGIQQGGMFMMQAPNGQQMQVQALVEAGQMMQVQVPGPSAAAAVARRVPSLRQAVSYKLYVYQVTFATNIYPKIGKRVTYCIWRCHFGIFLGCKQKQSSNSQGSRPLS